MEECSFKPKTLDYKGKPASETSGDKCIDLYSRVPKGKYASNKGKGLDDIKYEREKDDCTFQPNIKKKNQKQTQDIHAVKGVEEVLERFNKGR